MFAEINPVKNYTQNDGLLRTWLNLLRTQNVAKLYFGKKDVCGVAHVFIKSEMVILVRFVLNR